MKKVLIDTNFLFLFKKRVKFLEEIKYLVGPYLPIILLDNVRELLDKIRKIKSKDMGYFNLALKYLNKIVIVSSSSYKAGVDRKIINYALRNKVIVATNDRELRRALKRAKILTIYYREHKNKLEIS